MIGSTAVFALLQELKICLKFSAQIAYNWHVPKPSERTESQFLGEGNGAAARVLDWGAASKSCRLR